jgi:hypothetical protein
MGDPSPVDVRELPYIYRYFDEEAYANALIQGNVFISTLERCRDLEKPGQGDPEEGTHLRCQTYAFGDSDSAQIKEVTSWLPIRIDNSTNIEIASNRLVTRIPDAYVVCTTERPADKTSATFGKYCVEVSRPAKFFDLIDARLHRFRSSGPGEFQRVRYTQLEHYDLNPPPGEIGFVKRPDPYAEQQEIRLLWKYGVNPPLTPFELSVPGVSRLCRRIK